MKDLEEFIKKVIPYPVNYETRNGFNNESYIDSLQDEDKLQVGEALTELLVEHPEDMLIIDTLGYLKHASAVPALKNLFHNEVAPITRIKIATSILQITAENDLIGDIIRDFRKLDDPTDAYYTYKLITAFYYLAKLKNGELNKIIEEYVNHKEFLVSHNAKASLQTPLSVNEIIKKLPTDYLNKRIKSKREKPW